jgi:hypothetical protein
MRECTTDIDLGGDVLIDIDCSTNDSYVGITNKGYIIRPFGKIKIHQSFQFPIIRQINDNQFLVADARVSTRTDNCFIYDSEGKIIGQFFAGDGIQDIEIVKEKIIVTYFDEGVFGMDGPNNEGLIIFNLNGKILLSYNEKHGDQIISDCYCICGHGSNRILFLPYTEFQLIELNLDNGEETIYEIPEEIKGSNSITSTAESIIFHAPYDDKRGFFKWIPGDKKFERIGEYNEGLRGLKNGKFLAKREKGFTIIDFN